MLSLFHDQFTSVAAKGVSRAVSLAQELGNIEVTPLHLAAVLFKDPASLGVQLVQKAAVSGQNLSLDELQAALDKALRRLPRQDPPPSDIRPNGKFFAVLRKAQQLQKAQKDSHAAVDHILMALYEDADTGAVLAAAGLTRRKLEDAVKQVRGSRKITSVRDREHGEESGARGMGRAKMTQARAKGARQMSKAG